MTFPNKVRQLRCARQTLHACIDRIQERSAAPPDLLLDYRIAGECILAPTGCLFQNSKVIGTKVARGFIKIVFLKQPLKSHEMIGGRDGVYKSSGR